MTDSKNGKTSIDEQGFYILKAIHTLDKMGRWMESGTLELNNGQTWKYKLQRLKDKKVKKNV